MCELDAVDNLLFVVDTALERRYDHCLLLTPELVLAEHIVTVLLGKAAPFNDHHLQRVLVGLCANVCVFVCV